MTDYIINPLAELFCLDTLFNLVALGALCALPVVFGG